MPKVSTIKIQIKSAGSWLSTDVDVMVNASGVFYCEAPDWSKNYLQVGGNYHGIRFERRNRGAEPQIFSDTMALLNTGLHTIMKVCHTPEVTTELVIRYNIQSDVSFWETSDGNICPNGHFASRLDDSSDRDGRWCGGNEEKGMYGNHHSSNPSNGGYSLTVGAQAMIKRTEKLGEKLNITYMNYYGDEDHFGTKHPAARLNGWCSFVLNKDYKEIPYSDEAAIYFYNMMLGVATISRMIQKATFDQENLITAIKSGNSPLQIPNKKEKP
jgi:hypothetical protein